MLISVVLSTAKDLIAACNRHEILRFAQDDMRRAWRPAVRMKTHYATPAFLRCSSAVRFTLSNSARRLATSSGGMRSRLL